MITQRRQLDIVIHKNRAPVTGSATPEHVEVEQVGQTEQVGVAEQVGRAEEVQQPQEPQEVQQAQQQQHQQSAELSIVIREVRREWHTQSYASMPATKKSQEKGQ